NAGMDDYISKPIRSEELYAAISRAVKCRVRDSVQSSGEEHPEEVLQHLVAWDQALAHVGGDADLLRDLTATFLDEQGQWLSNIDAALERGDATGVRDAAHPFKNSLNLLGATKAGELMYRLEQMGRCQQLDQARQARAAF